MTINKRPIKDLVGHRGSLTATSFDVGLTRLGCALVEADIRGFLRSNSGLVDVKERKKIHLDARTQAQLIWDFVCNHAVVRFAETVNLLEEGESRAKRAKSVAATNYGEYFEIALLNRRTTLLHPAAAAVGGDGRDAEAEAEERTRARLPNPIPDMVVIESQGGVATSLIRQAYANFHRHLSTYYSTLWRCGLQVAVPMIHKDSGKAKGVFAACILKAQPDVFVSWMRTECDARDFISWHAIELPDRPVQDVDVDRAAAKYATHRDEAGFRLLLRKHMQAYARARIEREGDRDPWVAIFEAERLKAQKKIEVERRRRQKQQLQQNKKNTNTTEKHAPSGQPPGKFVASLFEDADARDVAGGSSERADGFLDYKSDLDVVEEEDNDDEIVKKSRDARGRAAVFGGERGAKMAIAASKRKREGARATAEGAAVVGSDKSSKTDCKLRREYNKVVVLCACETLFQLNPPKSKGGHMLSWYDKTWVVLRSASCATERDKRRDMADAILQGLANLWLCVASG